MLEKTETKTTHQCYTVEHGSACTKPGVHIFSIDDRIKFIVMNYGRQ